MKKVFAGIVLGFLISGVSYASESFDLKCDGPDFETPLMISVRGDTACIDGSWDVIDAIGEAKYDRLSAVRQGDHLTITEKNKKFKASLTLDEEGKYTGHVYMRDQSGEGVPSYSDRVSCERN